MRSIIIFLFVSLGICSADEQIISVSPDKRFQVVTDGRDRLGDPDGSRFAIRDSSRSSAIIATDNDFTFAGAFSFQDVKAEWSPNGQMVFIQVPGMTKRSADGAAYALLRWNGKRFTEIILPEDARPIRWAGNDQLVCSVRTEAVLQLSRDKASFESKVSKPK